MKLERAYQHPRKTKRELARLINEAAKQLNVRHRVDVQYFPARTPGQDHQRGSGYALREQQKLVRQVIQWRSSIKNENFGNISKEVRNEWVKAVLQKLK